MTQQGDTTSQEPGPAAPGQGDAGAPPGPPGAPPGPADATSGPAGAPPGSAAETAGTEQANLAAPVWPSPYLSGGQPVPEAYPAPAQPGQARYGDAAAPVQGTRRAGFGQPGAGQPGAGQPGAGRPGAGRPTYPQRAYRSRPMLGARPLPQRDPVLASAWERLLAMTLDWILIMAAAILILHGPLLRLWDQFQSLESSSLSLSQTASQAAVTNFMQAHSTASALQNFRLLLFGLALAYFWGLTATGGATVGKRLLGLRAVTAADRSGLSVQAAGIRAAVFLIGPALFAFAPGVGLLSSDLTLTAGAVLWLADWVVMLADPRRTTLHDRAAGTVVVRKSQLDQQQARQSASW